MHVRNVLHAACWKYRTQKWRKKIPSGHRRKTISGYIFTTKACIDNRKKLVKHQYLSRSSHNMVNFGPLAAEICWRVWAPQQISTGFAFVTAPHSSSEHQPNFPTGRPSRWALVHILSIHLNYSQRGHAASQCKIHIHTFHFWEHIDISDVNTDRESLHCTQCTFALL